MDYYYSLCVRSLSLSIFLVYTQMKSKKSPIMYLYSGFALKIIEFKN